MRRILLIVTIVFVVFLSAISALAQQPTPTGRPIALSEILTFTQNLGDYLYTFASILVAIVLVWSGVVYMLAGSDTAKVKKAKDILKAGIIGAFIIFGVGTILATVRLIGTGGSIFSGGGGGGGAGPRGGTCVDSGGGNLECEGGTNAGNPCTATSNC